MRKINYIFVALLLAMGVSSCKQDFLDRQPKDSLADTPDTWQSEQLIELYTNDWFPSFFTGFPDASEFSDDGVQRGRQGNFGRAVPTSAGWSMWLVRSINLMLDRMKEYSEGHISPSAYKHWEGVARMYRGQEYSDLTFRYGDVPYYDREILSTELDELYKPRDPRNMVMDKVEEDFRFALENIRGGKSTNNQITRDVAGALISRTALEEGTFQKYYYKDTERAKKFLTLAVDAAEIVINSGRYGIVMDFRSLYTTDDLSTSREVILHKAYSVETGVLHSRGHYSNPKNTINYGGNTDLMKAFICVDGETWNHSSVEGAKSFDMKDVITSRDSRFEATFFHEPREQAFASLLFPVKFMSRAVLKQILETGTVPSEWDGTKQVTDYPTLRYSEVLLNWIEAKAELATLGGPAVTQEDIDKSINAIRKRPLAKEAIERGVKQTKAMELTNLPEDPNRDPMVPQLLWEIRRERRMEFAFEGYRYTDLKRWGKFEYMDTDKNPDLLSGAWVDFTGDYKKLLKKDVMVVKSDGKEVEYDGKNTADMIGFYKETKTEGRLPFTNLVNVNIYLSPVGKTQMDDYERRGYHLQQTEGWPQNNK